MDLTALAADRPLRLRALFVPLFLLVASALPVLGGSLRGVVIDPDARPVARADVRVVGPIGARLVRTDAEGRFEVRDLPAATYDLLVEAAGLQAPTHRVTMAPEGDVEIRIPLTLGAVNETIVVSAAHVEVPLSSAPGSVTVVDRAELKARQIDNLGDALRHVPGLNVSRNGGPGALTSLFPRGGESDYTLVLVDGIRVNTFGGGLDLSRLALAGVEQIEVVRGPQSAQYGAEAIGGVIQMVSRSGGRPSAEAMFEGGSRDSTHYALSSAGSHGRWSWLGAADRQASDGENGNTTAQGEQVTNDDWLRRHASAGLGYAPSPHASLRANGRVSKGERGAPGPYGSDPLGFYGGIDEIARGRHNDAQFGVTADHSWGKLLEGRARQRWSFNHADFDSDFRSAFQGVIFDSGLETRRDSIRTQSDLLVAASTSLSAGFEISAERARSTFVTGGQSQEVPIERRAGGYFAELRQDLGPSMALTAGLRLEHFRREALEGNPFARPAFPEDTTTSLNPRVSWVWRAISGESGTPETRLHVSAGTGIRAPDVFEIAFTDNPELQPERSRSVEAGVSQRLRPLDVSVQLTGFYNRYDDLIVAVGTSLRDASRYRTDNISNARSRGVELAADWRSSWGLLVRGAYTWLDTEVLAVDGSSVAPPPFAPGDPLIRRPSHRGSLAAQLTLPRVTAFAEMSARGRTLDVEPNLGAGAGLFENPGHAVVDAGVSTRLTRHAELFARALNLLDRRYEETLGYPAPSRRGMVGVRLAVGE